MHGRKLMGARTGLLALKLPASRFLLLLWKSCLWLIYQFQVVCNYAVKLCLTPFASTLIMLLLLLIFPRCISFQLILTNSEILRRRNANYAANSTKQNWYPLLGADPKIRGSFSLSRIKVQDLFWTYWDLQACNWTYTTAWGESELQLHCGLT